MRTREALAETRRRLAGAGIPDAALEAEVLLMHASGMSRAQLYAALSDPWPADSARRLGPMVQRRRQREPLAYITEHREFFGLDLAVDGRVLVPRQETETVVEQALELARRHFPDGACRIADVGTGSGAIAVSLAKHLPNARIVATDVSAEALEVAAINCKRHGVAGRVRLAQGDLLQPVTGCVDIVVANLPYVPSDALERLQPEIRDYEPRVAVLAGPTGLELVERLLDQIEVLAEPPLGVVLELTEGQPRRVGEEMRRRFPTAHVTVFKDLGRLERGVTAEGITAPASGGRRIAASRC